MRKYSALFLFVLFATSLPAQIFTNGQAARAVYGQINFTTGSTVPSQQVLGGVGGIAYYKGQLFVADDNRVGASPLDHRIMIFNTNQVPGLRDNILTQDSLSNSDCYLCGFLASISLGQTGFASVDSSGNQTAFSPGRTASLMNSPTAVATDGHIFAVADTDNNRILIWKSIPTMMNQPADLVLGQPDFTTLQSPPVGTVNSTTMRGPQGVWIQNNELFVADTQNYRILIWTSIPTTNNQAPNLVLGQADFNHIVAPAPTAANPVAAANRLLNPVSVTSDGTRLFVSDLGFNRVLIWNSIPTTQDQNADVVVGQPDMVSTAANNASVCGALPVGTIGQCQNSLNYPRFALSDGTHLYIADGGNDRVLYFNSIPTINGAYADRVLGEPDFVQDVVTSANISIASTAVDNTGAVDLTPTPMSLALDEQLNLYVSDPYNRRVLVFTPGDTLLPPDSVVNWASEIIRQEGIVALTGTIVANDTVTITIQGTDYTYTIKKTDTLDSVAKTLAGIINAGNDPNVTAIFAGVGTSTVYLSSIQTSLAYDSISLSAATSNTTDITATASGGYLSAGTAGTGAIGMLVEINGTNLSDSIATSTLDGITPLPNTLNGVQVYMDGYPSPLLKISPTQIVTQIPYAFQDRNSTSVYVRTAHANGTVTVTNPVPVYIAPANPGIFNAPTYPGQARPWPISMAYHQPGNPTAVVSVDGSVTAADTATITINGTPYTYTVVAADTLTTIQTNLINLINASDPNVVASAGTAFNRIILTAIQPGAAGNGISVTGTTSSTASVTITAYSATTCCVVTPNSLITAANPAAPGELITISTAGLGIVTDPTGVAQGSLGTGVPYAGPVPNGVPNFVSATLGGTTAQVVNSGLPAGSYGTYNVQLVVPPAAATNSITPLYIAQNAFISNTVTLPVGPPVLANPSAPSTPPSVSPFTIFIDTPTDGSTVSGPTTVSGWAFDTNAAITGIQVLVDGTLYGNATVGIARPDVCVVYPSEPGCPNLGWSFTLQTTLLADGAHTLQIRATGADGLHYNFPEQIIVANTGNPSPTHVFIDVPGVNGNYRGVTNFGGWAVDDGAAISRITLTVDGAIIGTTTSSVARPDVCSVYPGLAGCPTVGWTFQYDTNLLTDGPHTFAMTAVAANGDSATTSSNFAVQNFTGVGTTTITIDNPNVNTGTLSGTLAVAGWAIDANASINYVSVAVDSVSYGQATYGVARPDVCAVYPNAGGCPNVGYNANIDTTFLSDGPHALAITAAPAIGQPYTTTTVFVVGNQGISGNPVQVQIDGPSGGTTVSGVATASGWALSATDTVSSVALTVDGLPIGNATYGTISRVDVCASYPGSPGCPLVGWTGAINTSLLGNGPHVLEATATTTHGQRATSSSNFTVSNTATVASHLFIDVPAGATNPFMGLAKFRGWALNDTTSVTSVSVAIDGVPYGTAVYGQSRPDVCAAYPGRAGCPNVGFTYSFDTTQFPDGVHTVAFTQNNRDGTFYTQSNTFTIGNYTTTDPMHLFIDQPVAVVTSPVFGTTTISGWAVDDNITISAVQIAVDGTVIGTANYGLSRPDVCVVYNGDPGCPNVGYTFSYDTTFLSNGIHTLSITGITPIGQTSTISQLIGVAN